MPKILVSLKKKGKEWIPLFDSPVFVDMPMAIAELHREYEDPIIVSIEKGLPTIMERSEYDEYIESLEIKEHEKIFYFKIENGNKLVECSPEESVMSQKLPKDTDVKQLFYINNQVVMLDIKGGED